MGVKVNRTEPSSTSVSVPLTKEQGKMREIVEAGGMG
jgi:hypothetical protein